MTNRENVHFEAFVIPPMMSIFCLLESKVYFWPWMMFREHGFLEAFSAQAIWSFFISWAFLKLLGPM